jgi:endonuclease/exonuclease/phosphatase family metal-dependent hydrolase
MMYRSHPMTISRRGSISTVLSALLLALLIGGCSDDTVAADLGPSAESSLPSDARADTSGDLLVDAPRADVGVDTLPADLGPDLPVVPFELRIMAANLTSGTAQSYTPGHGARIIKALAPDVVLIQEFNYGSKSPADIAAFVKSTLGAGFHYYREAGAIPNGIISRWPIIASGEWNDPEVSNRDFAWAQIDLPGPHDLYAISVHFLSSQSSKRTKEANALLAQIEQHVPAGSLLVLGGDFNTKTRNEGCVATLRKRLTAQTPYPVDQAGNGNTNAGRNSPYDWVLASPALHALEIPLSVGSKTFPAGLVFDSRVYTPLSDVPPVLVGDSDATQMQHMAVVRQFRITP